MFRVTGAGLLLSCAMVMHGAAAAPQGAPAFKHIVIIVQENRTPDNLFGSNPVFEPGVDLARTGTNSQGQQITLTAEPLAGCYDISHRHAAFKDLFDGGKMDGADQEPVSARQGCSIPANPQFKFVANGRREVQPYFDIARQYGFANRMFQTNQGPSFPAHQFIFGGTSAPHETSPLFVAENVQNIRLGAGCVAPPRQRVKVIDAAGSETSNPPIYPCLDHATLVPLLDQAGMSWKYYINTLQDSALWTAPAAVRSTCGARQIGKTLRCMSATYLAHVDRRQAQVLADIGACRLPNVSWVIPDAADSDHAAINTGMGPAWVVSIINAIGTRQICGDGDDYWKSTAILITWDDWGGWYDHVKPYHSGGWGSKNWGAGYTYGLRVPLLVVSAYTPAGYVDNGNHDFGSILHFVESNFSLGHIGPGNYADAWADDLSAFFTLGSPRDFALLAAQIGPEHFFVARRSAAGPDDDD